jgi:hypothetical protein
MAGDQDVLMQPGRTCRAVRRSRLLLAGKI